MLLSQLLKYAGIHYHAGIHPGQPALYLLNKGEVCGALEVYNRRLYVFSRAHLTKLTHKILPAYHAADKGDIGTKVFVKPFLGAPYHLFVLGRSYRPVLIASGIRHHCNGFALHQYHGKAVVYILLHLIPVFLGAHFAV